jgi:hypothetical protein
MDRGLLVIALVMVSASFAPIVQGEHFQHCGLEGVRYEVIFLGALGLGGGGGEAINDRGEVAGTASVSDTVGRAFIWDCERGMQNIGAISDDHYASLAYDINIRGEVVGQSVNDDVSIAFIWDRTKGLRAITDASALAYDINDWSEVILFGGPSGLSYWSASTGIQAVWDRVDVQGYGEPFINNARSIGAMRVDETFALQFFNWNPRSGLRDVAAVPTTYFTTYLAEMNDRGDLIGNAGTALGWVPFLVTHEGELQQLEASTGAEANANGLNNRRQVVGTLRSLSGEIEPYIWDPRNGLRDLNELRTNAAPAIRSVEGINNWGWIAGSAAQADGSGEAALIVPVPENSRYFRNLSRLSGARLCRALDAVKAHAVVSCLLQGR